MAQARFGKCREGAPSPAHWEGGNSSLLFQLGVPASSDAANSTNRHDIQQPSLDGSFQSIINQTKNGAGFARIWIDRGSCDGFPPRELNTQYVSQDRQYSIEEAVRLLPWGNDTVSERAYLQSNMRAKWHAIDANAERNKNSSNSSVELEFGAEITPGLHQLHVEFIGQSELSAKQREHINNKPTKLKRVKITVLSSC
jgi:hypothetical protein